MKERDVVNQKNLSRINIGMTGSILAPNNRSRRNIASKCMLGSYISIASKNQKQKRVIHLNTGKELITNRIFSFNRPHTYEYMQEGSKN